MHPLIVIAHRQVHRHSRLTQRTHKVEQFLVIGGIAVVVGAVADPPAPGRRPVQLDDLGAGLPQMVAHLGPAYRHRLVGGDVDVGKQRDAMRISFRRHCNRMCRVSKATPAATDRRGICDAKEGAM